MKTKLLFFLAVLSLSLIAAAPLSTGGLLDDGPVIFGGNYTLVSGDTLNGDLVVFGGNVTIEEAALVKGSIVIFGGTISLDGTLAGDLVLIGATGSMGEKSIIEGDLVTVGASFSRAEGARIEGDVREEPPIEIPVPVVPAITAAPVITAVPDVAPVPEIPIIPEQPININPVGSAFGVLSRAVLIAALAMLLVLFMRPQMEQVAQTVTCQPWLTGGVGLVTVILFPFALLLMLITIILILGIPLAVLGIIIAWLFGVMSIGKEVGERFTHAIGQDWAPVLTAGFGTFLLELVAEGLGLIPCIGWLAPFALSVMGIGAVVLTLFERKISPPTGTASAPVTDETLPPPA